MEEWLNSFLTLAPDGDEETGWAPESVWTFWRTEKSLISAGFRIQGHQTRSLVTTPSVSVLGYNIGT